jgi:hypothetical protein
MSPDRDDDLTEFEADLTRLVNDAMTREPAIPLSQLRGVRQRYRLAARRMIKFMGTGGASPLPDWYDEATREGMYLLGGRELMRIHVEEIKRWQRAEGTCHLCGGKPLGECRGHVVTP